MQLENINQKQKTKIKLKHRIELGVRLKIHDKINNIFDISGYVAISEALGRGF